MNFLTKLFNNETKEKNVEPAPPPFKLEEQPRESEKIIENIHNDFVYRTKRTIKDWREALQSAESINPNRKPLLDIYNDVILDTSLEGAIHQRIEKVLSTNFELVNIGDGRKNSLYDELFTSQWFYKTLEYAMESKFYGHSLIQIEGVTEDNNIWDVSLVPRENVIPEFGQIKRKQNSNIGDFSYRKDKYYKWLLEYQKSPKDLGLLMKLTPIILYKKEALKSWNRFSELFGMPIRVGKTAKKNIRDRKRLFDMLKNMASNASIVLDLEDDIEFKEASSGDANKVFENLISTLNKEIYKTVLGQTMSSEDSASYSQAYIHAKMFNYKTLSDLRELEFWINRHLLPKLQSLGVIENNLKFRWIDEEKMLQSERMEIDSKILRYYDIDPSYIEDRYKVPITGVKSSNPSGPEGESIDREGEQKTDVDKRID